MLDKELLRQTVQEAIAETPLFLVDLTVSADNVVVVEVDSPTGVDIDQCAAVSRAVHAAFDQDAEDYELEVGSAGLTAPFKVIDQYIKNIGKPLEVLTLDGRKLRGQLVEVNTDDRSFVIAVPTKVKAEGQKRPQLVDVPERLAMDQCRSVCYDIDADLKNL